LAAVFGGGSEKVVDGQGEKRTAVDTLMSGN